MEKRVDFYKWIRELQGDEKTAWHNAAKVLRDKIEKESDKINKLPAWNKYGWMVGDAYFGKDVWYGGRGRPSRVRRYHARRQAEAAAAAAAAEAAAHHQRELNPHAQSYRPSAAAAAAAAEAAKEKAEEEELLRDATSSHLKGGYGRRTRKHTRRSRKTRRSV
jgi:hypothetical protein